ncbi:MAG: tRNA dimethylallyltransferase, partial [Candidatus Cloacimonadaceae bacterium]|nr:tRNA dimethylallyltransferase [Candidatus Cloacimonadaceae bacterium]
RGMEVFLGTGKTISTHWQEQQSPSHYDTFRILIDPPRELLYERINLRMRRMVDSGLLEEINKLLDMGFSASSPGLNSLGYKEFLPYLQGGEELEACTLKAAQHSRNYAKRQATWYRKQKFDLTITDDCINMYDVTRSIPDMFRRSI